ncbi:MAG: hypothetical protein M0R77_16870 [Gammaproteobacteria bacterium]|nr:hypothetical protein [Gammaproteobacteria bacterium]
MLEWFIGWITGRIADYGFNNLSEWIRNQISTDYRRWSNMEKIKYFLGKEVVGKNLGQVIDEDIAKLLKINYADVVKCLNILHNYGWINYHKTLSSGPFSLSVKIEIFTTDFPFKKFDKMDMERSIQSIKNELVKSPSKSLLVSEISSNIGQSRYITIGALVIMERDGQIFRSKECGLLDFKFCLI